MLKKIFFIILSLNLLTHCEYKPVYSKQNNAGLKIMISGFTGDKDINNFIVVTTFVIRKDDNTENFVVRDKFNFKKMTDKYEEKNYELNIKRNLANSISQKLILRLAVN